MLAIAGSLPARSTSSRSRCRSLLSAIVAGIAVYGISAPLLAIAHELIVLGTAHLIGDLTWLAASSGALRALPLDPIYTSAMLLTLGGIEPRGLALAGWVGERFNELWPALFESSALVAPRAWASAVVAPGSTIVSRWLCSIVADAALVSLGLLAMRQASDGRSWLAVVGAIVQAHVVVTHLVDVPPELIEVEAAGIPFAVAMIVSGDVQAGPRLSEQLARLDEPVRNVVLGLGMVALAYLPVLTTIAAYRLTRALWKSARSVQRRADRAGVTSRAARLRPQFRPGALGWTSLPISLGRVVALMTLALAVAVSPLGDLADAQTRFLAASLEAEPTSDDPLLATAAPTEATMPPQAATGPTAGAASTASAAALAVTPPPGADEPSVVAVAGSGYQYQYTVNGTPQVIRGIGYNIQYRHLPPEERARRLDRDFARLRQIGVNTVFGWEPVEFDQVLLDTAHKHGLGVAPPYHLDPEAAYGDPAVRQIITQDVLAWVEQYRGHPALRMWAIGNEVLHKLVYPSWMPMRSDPAWEQRAHDFALFYVELIDKVRAADPNHPIVHRDAEDAYLTWLRDAMQASGRRPWFIYGINSYTPRLGEILTSWPTQGWDVPLLVSEFAPGGMSPADRPQGFRSMWQMIRGANAWTLGGAVYAWTTDGPEEVDRVFGLVDADGKEVDGAFNTIGSLYRGVARQSEPEPSQPGQVHDDRIWTFARQAVSAIQAGRSTELLATADSSIMGDVNAISLDPATDAELVVRRVRDPRRIAWARETGVLGEWWVTWLPPATPGRKLTFVVQERQDGVLGVRYIYHGPR